MNRKTLSVICALLMSAMLFGIAPAEIYAAESAAEADIAVNNQSEAPNDLEETTSQSITVQAPESSADASQNGVFSDVGKDHLFYEEITLLTDLGILNGYPDGSFLPEKEITNAEFTKVLFLCLSKPIPQFPSGTEPLFPESWASAFLTAAYLEGFLTDEMLADDYSPDAPITRGVMTEMTVRALELFVPEGSESPFIDTDDRYAVAAYEEYILRGYPAENGKRLCKPDSSAVRGEASAIATRVIRYIEDPYEYKKAAILDNAANYPLTTESEFLDLFYILNREFMTEFTFTTPLSYNTWLSYNRLANVLYLEYYYSSYLNCTYKKNSDVYTVKLEYSDDTETLRYCHIASEAVSDAVIALIITDDMTDYEKIEAIHDYLVLNCEYDYENYSDSTIQYRSRLAYGALCDRKAICQGYCAAFNMLAKKAGIRSAVVTGYTAGSTDSHAWNMVYADGAIYYIDVTHDDPVPDKKGSVSYKYFMRTEEEMIDLGYIWDPNQTQFRYLW